MSEMIESGTSQANRSALPEAWIDRLFLRFAQMYGKLWLDMWEGIPIDGVKSTWSADLAGFGAEQIKRALDHCKANNKFPPTCPEFVGLCRQFRGAPAHQLYLAAPVSRMPPEIAEQLRAFVGKVRSGGDCRKWARKIVAKPHNYPGLSRQYALEALGVDEKDAIRGADNYKLIAEIAARCPVDEAA